ncbi:RDD family protein [Clostridium amazonitimonense]|uniref:RDD family protein n=1 Tax=Clostridium amazonitimonense TaxID=1499689 RepID=UPI0005099857|nr:RDD family protein [Clostridium amazonitimonense]
MRSNLFNRLGALAMDMLIIIILPLGIFIYMGIDTKIAFGYSAGLYLAYSFLVPIITNGYTLGKYLLGLRIFSEERNSLNPLQILHREISKLMYTVPLLGLLLIIFSFYIINKSSKGQGLHDLFAKTKVNKL